MTTRTKSKPKAKRKATSDRHYIDNAKFHAALTEYQKEVSEAKVSGAPKPMVPDYIAHSILILARKVARRSRFARYPFIEDMIGDAIVCCIRNLHNFNPSLPTAFPYFTQIVWHSFFQRIEKERKDLYRRFKAVMERQKEMVGVVGYEGVQVYGSRYTDLQMREFCQNFEEQLAEKRKKSKERKKASAKGQFTFDEE